MSRKVRVEYTEIAVDDYDVAIFEWGSMNTITIPIDEWEAVKIAVDKLIDEGRQPSVKTGYDFSGVTVRDLTTDDIKKLLKK